MEQLFFGAKKAKPKATKIKAGQKVQGPDKKMHTVRLDKNTGRLFITYKSQGLKTMGQQKKKFLTQPTKVVMIKKKTSKSSPKTKKSKASPRKAKLTLAKLRKFAREHGIDEYSHAKRKEGKKPKLAGESTLKKRIKEHGYDLDRVRELTKKEKTPMIKEHDVDDEQTKFEKEDRATAEALIDMYYPNTAFRFPEKLHIYDDEVQDMYELLQKKEKKMTDETDRNHIRWLIDYIIDNYDVHKIHKEEESDEESDEESEEEYDDKIGDLFDSDADSDDDEEDVPDLRDYYDEQMALNNFGMRVSARPRKATNTVGTITIKGKTKNLFKGIRGGLFYMKRNNKVYLTEPQVRSMMRKKAKKTKRT